MRHKDAVMSLADSLKNNPLARKAWRENIVRAIQASGKNNPNLAAELFIDGIIRHAAHFDVEEAKEIRPALVPPPDQL